MILLNKLVRIDLALLVAVICFVIFRNGTGNAGSFFLGLSVGIFLLSLGLHVRHYREYKKFY
jgi:hypothetical protein